jgi:hypothetical protein
MRASIMLVLTVILFVAAAMLPEYAGLLVVCGLLAACLTALVAVSNNGGGKSSG